MNKDAIKNTAVCRWDAKQKCYIVQSPLYDPLIGAAATESDAWEIFEDFLDDAYTSYLEGRLGGMYNKRGRPAKHRAAVHCEVLPHTREELKHIANQLGCSQGEAVDYLVAFFNATQTTKSVKDAAAKVGTRSGNKTAALSARKKVATRRRV